MGRIHVCLLCCLPVTIRGLVGSYRLQKFMHRECVFNITTEHVTHKTPNLLWYNTHFLGYWDEQPRKTTLETINTEKTLTVPETLFYRECVPFSMHGCMESMTINHHPFRVRPRPVPHFCCVRDHMGPFEDPKTRGRGHHGRTRASVDLGATLNDSFD